MKRKTYEAELRTLHGELVAMQEWVKATGAKICVVFEGRDTAGKGGTIKAITERVSPRVFRVVALPAPTEREKSQMYVQRYIAALPGGRRGRDLRPQLVQPRRRRAGDGLLHRGAGGSGSSSMAPPVEKAMVDSGIILLKYWLEVSPEEQTRRLESADRRRREDLEAVADGPEVLQPLVRLLPGPRRDVRRHRHRMGALVRRATPTTRSGPASTSSPTSWRRSLRAAPGPRGEATETPRAAGYVEPDLPVRRIQERF